VVVLLDPFEPDRPGALGAALLGLTAGEVLLQDGGRDDADLDLDEHLREGVVLGIVELDLQRALAIWGVFWGRIRAGR